MNMEIFEFGKKKLQIKKYLDICVDVAFPGRSGEYTVLVNSTTSYSSELVRSIIQAPLGCYGIIEAPHCMPSAS